MTSISDMYHNKKAKTSHLNDHNGSAKTAFAVEGSSTHAHGQNVA
jgi:hypothetical protein